MRILTLTKHHAFGNDFLVTFHPHADDLAALARAVCDRRRGIGADGLLIGESAPDHSASVTIYNADGGQAEMSGNGIRCFAQALAMRRGDDLPVTMTLLTVAGTRVVEVEPSAEPAVVMASVDMGAVELIEPPTGWSRLGVDPGRPVAHLSVGNPHAVLAVEDVTAVDLLKLGRAVPDVNLEIIEQGPEPHAVTMRVHERGAGITEACGTGAVAAAWAAADWGLVDPTHEELVVHMDGGSATVALHRPQLDHVTLTGPATYIGAIEIPFP
jgi:diaminopimelate epimerase